MVTIYFFLSFHSVRILKLEVNSFLTFHNSFLPVHAIGFLMNLCDFGIFQWPFVVSLFSLKLVRNFNDNLLNSFVLQVSHNLVISCNFTPLDNSTSAYFSCQVKKKPSPFTNSFAISEHSFSGICWTVDDWFLAAVSSDEFHFGPF